MNHSLAGDAPQAPDELRWISWTCVSTAMSRTHPVISLKTLLDSEENSERLYHSVGTLHNYA